jgi:DNA polymerase-3 subunit epsilon
MNKYNGYKKCFIDVETTGTDRKLHNIFQISGAITDEKDNILERFDYRFRPLSIEHYEDGALEQTGMTIQKLVELPMSAGEAYNAFTTLLGKFCNKYNRLDKYQMIAYNSSFDSDFLREFFSKHNDNYIGSWFFTPALCLMQATAWFLIDHRAALPNFKLGTLCQAAGLGWDEKSAHDASYDIDQSIKLYKYIRENTKVLCE